MKPETKAEMIQRVLIQPMMARYRLPDRFSSVEAAIEDYTEAMVPFCEQAIADGFRRAKSDHEYPWWPDLPKLLASVRIAASEISVRDGVGSTERAAVIARANARGPAYARWYMDQLRWQHVAAAWTGGYFREMREYISAQAVRQILDGSAEPHVEVPREQIEAWSERAKRTGGGGGMSRENREVADRLIASIRAKAERAQEPAKQVHVAGAAE